MAARALALVSLLCAAGAADARVRRVALVVGHNTGDRREAALRYAERDARRMASVLRELGSFDAVRLRVAPTAAQLRAELERVKRVVRGWKAARSQVLLLFFYSGHGDGRDLHLGGTSFPGDELLQRVRDCGAELRIVVLDACQAGAFTKDKGLKPRPPIKVVLLDELEATGQAILASTSRGESAQESELLQGSFFTSNLVTGLRGTADTNGDGQVSLREAYAYAYHRTVRSTVASVSGIQHPTYDVKLTGKRDVALTWPRRSRSFLSFRSRSAGRFLVLSKSESAVVAEVPARRGSSRRIGLQPGDYVVKKRSSRGLMVARVRLPAGADAVLDESSMSRVPYAVLARKGRLAPGWLALSAGLSTSLLSVQTPFGVQLGYVLDLEWLALWPELAVDFGGGEAGGLEVSLVTVRPALSAVYLLRFARWNVFLGLQGGLPVYLHSVQGQDRRTSLGVDACGVAGIGVWLSRRAGLWVRVLGGVHVLRLETGPVGDTTEGWQARGAASTQVGLKLRF